MNIHSLKIPILALLVVVALFLLPDTKNTEIETQQTNARFVIQNQGGALEGHTPRGFAGTGTGLFVGDNINSNFPEGDGVQMFLTFDLSTLQDVQEVSSAQLVSVNAHVEGTPFADLGNLIVERVQYKKFSRDLWNREALGKICVLTPSSSGFSCDVTTAIHQTVSEKSPHIQFRVRFEKAGDFDGKQDMVSFFKINSNTNEPGLFELQITSKEVRTIQVPLVVYLVQESAEVTTGRDEEELKTLLVRSQKIWNQAHVELDISFEKIVLSKELINAVAIGNFRSLYTLIPKNDTRLHIFYVNSLLGPNGIALSPQVALVADVTSVDDFRVTAHEIGHLLGLGHTTESRSRLMFPGANGRILVQEEIDGIHNN